MQHLQAEIEKRELSVQSPKAAAVALTKAIGPEIEIIDPPAALPRLDTARAYFSRPEADDRLAEIHRNVLVGGRHLALPMEEYPGLRGFTDANNAFIRCAVDLGERAIRDGLARAGLEPTATGIIALGVTRQLTRSLWIEVESAGTTGWVSLAFVGYQGPTDDATAATIDVLGGRPIAPTMSELGLLVAIGVSGLLMKFVVHTDVIRVKEFFQGLYVGQVHTLPADPLMMLHLLDIGIEHFWSFPLTLASVTVFDLSGDVAQLRAHNLDAHIAALGPITERPPGAL